MFGILIFHMLYPGQENMAGDNQMGVNRYVVSNHHYYGEK